MQRVRSGDLKPQEVVDAHLDAIDLFDSRIHAYIHVDRNARTTSGVTLAVKDSQPVAGMPYTYGRQSWRGWRAEQDAVPVSRARTAGMAILGKTNLPELAASIGTTNTIFSATQRPWREGVTPGGSSGGSGAAVAAGMASVALGGDTGGSIRIPASCCGVVGLRPTPDRIPSEEVDVIVLQSRGPMTRTVADARLLFSVMTATSSNGAQPNRRALIGMADSSALGADPAVREACHRAARALEWARYVQFVLPVSFARTPAISIPAGLHDGLPVGVQLVGRFAQEYELLDFAEQLEKMPGFGFQRPPDME